MQRFRRYFLFLNQSSLAALLTQGAVFSLILAGANYYILSQYVRHSVHQFGHSFENQSFVELSSQDTYLIAQRLNAALEAIPWHSASGTRNGHSFYQRERPGHFPFPEASYTIQRSGKDQIEIEVTAGASPFVLILFLVNVLLQIYLVFSALLVQRVIHHRVAKAREEYLGELEQLAHDLRSPAAALRQLSLMAADRNSGEFKELIQMTGERVRDIVEGMRQRISGLKHVSEKATAQDITDVIQSVVAEKQETLGIPIGFHCEVENAEGRFTHAAELGRCVSNLIDNGAQSFPEGGAGKVAVYLQFQRGCLIVEVRDDGPGIPADILEKLKLGQRVTGKSDGLGLGNLGLRKYLQLCRGSVEYRTSDQGTTVRLVVPSG